MTSPLTRDFRRPIPKKCRPDPKTLATQEEAEIPRHAFPSGAWERETTDVSEVADYAADDCGGVLK